MIQHPLMAELQDVCKKVMANIDEKNPDWLSEFTRMECNVWMVGARYTNFTNSRIASSLKLTTLSIVQYDNARSLAWQF